MRWSGTVNKLETDESLSQHTNLEGMALLYFGSQTCGVCQALKPKVEQLMTRFPKITSGEVDINHMMHVSSSFQIFTIPVIMVLIDGKEVIREARHISLIEFEQKLQKLYGLYYNE
jgi:thiol-disulfide isomerase/thioredoxin